jgi:hypothetical protein
VGPSGQAVNKRERSWFGFGPKEVMGRLEAHRFGLGSQGQLGLRLSRPARANGLATRERMARLDPSADRLLLLPGLGPPSFLLPLWLGCPFTFSSSRAGGVVLLLLTDRAGPGVSARGIRYVAAQIRCGGRVCACAWGARRRVQCERLRGARGNAPETWPRRERDVAVASRGGRARRGPGRRAAARLGCARTRAGPGIPGPRRGRAVRGAPAAWVRGPTRRRGATAVAGEEAARRAPARRSGTAAGGTGGPRDGYTEGSSAWPAAVGKRRGYGGDYAHRRG